jgi:hypothetical protein
MVEQANERRGSAETRRLAGVQEAKTARPTAPWLGKHCSLGDGSLQQSGGWCTTSSSSIFTVSQHPTRLHDTLESSFKLKASVAAPALLLLDPARQSFNFPAAFLIAIQFLVVGSLGTLL